MENAAFSSADLTEFMKSMREMKMSVDGMGRDLGREIRDSKEEIKDEIQRMNEKIDREVKAVKEGTENLKKDLTEVRKENNDRMKRMEDRMGKIEAGGDNLEKQKRKRDEIEMKSDDRIQPTGRTYREIVKQKQDTTTDIAEQVKVHPNGSESKNAEKEVPAVENTSKSPEYKSTWARQMSQISLETQLKIATDAAARLEEGDNTEETEFRRKERGRKVKKLLKLGDSNEFHENADWPWDMHENDWDGTSDRGERNRIKKQKEKERREKKLDKAIRVGKCTIGVGPVKEQSYDYFNNITGDYNEAKKMAAAEYLTEYLKFNHQDMNDFDITDTRVSKKDDILYLVLDSPSKVRDIRRRIADCQNPDIKSRDYIPPIFYDRYTTLSRYARDLRLRDKSLKTQIRFLEKDIGLFVKTKGTDDPLTEMKMEDIEKDCRLPPVDYSVKWQMRDDKQPWRRTSPDINRRVVLKSLGDKAISPSSQREPSSKKNRYYSPESGNSADENSRFHCH